ncbi:MAG: hypothetical protein PHU25_15600 [Deltaproteobacteria bacterium]|nr:hypothetical protein [Deltaproteobacteria bacterium]
MDEGFSVEDRILCPDGACIGVIGPDGRCKVCGVSSVDGDASPPTGEAPEFKPGVDDPADLDPSDRVCCPDGTCVGILGPEGRCGVCGRSS